MGNKNDKKERINVVYSTNPNYQYEYNQEEEQETLAPEKQNLRVTLDSKQRKGKEVQPNHHTGCADVHLHGLVPLLWLVAQVEHDRGDDADHADYY